MSYSERVIFLPFIDAHISMLNQILFTIPKQPIDESQYIFVGTVNVSLELVSFLSLSLSHFSWIYSHSDLPKLIEIYLEFLTRLEVQWTSSVWY